MANKNIKGITIELDGNTTGLQKALKTVDSTSVKLNSELKEVNKLLKFDIFFIQAMMIWYSFETRRCHEHALNARQAVSA